MAVPKEKPMVFLITDEYSELKGKVHDRLVDMLDLSLIDSLDRQLLKQEIRRLTERILAEESSVDAAQLRRARAVPGGDLQRGPRPGADRAFHERPHGLRHPGQHPQAGLRGKIRENQHHGDAVFKDDTHLRQIIDKIVSAVGRRIDESSPMVDARLADGSRVNAIIPPSRARRADSLHPPLCRTPWSWKT